MAISRMEKILIVAHRSQAADLLEALQEAGIVQILDALLAMVSKEWPQLEAEVKPPREMEELIGRLSRATAFLKEHAKAQDGRSMLQPWVAVDKKTYTDAVGTSGPALLKKTEAISQTIEKLKLQAETARTEIQRLSPWKKLQVPLEQLGQFKSVHYSTGLIPTTHFKAAVEALADLAVVKSVDSGLNAQSCLILCMRQSTPEVQKILRQYEFEPVNFEGQQGTAADNLARWQNQLNEIEADLKKAKKDAQDLSDQRLTLEILSDHYHNLLIRRLAETTSPTSQTTVFLEGWTRRKDYPRVEAIVKRFEACDVTILIPGEGEEPPVDIENAASVRPFEAVTRLYGMPIPTSIDPTLFLAPFFAVFFGLCLADAGYGLFLIAALAWMLKKAQGDKKMFRMLLICGVATFLVGAATGGWFGDAASALIPQGTKLYEIIEGNPQLDQPGLRQRIMLFDPMTQPMIFFLLSLGLGYLQIQFGLLIAFFSNLFRKDWAAALCDQLVWVIHLNCLLGLGLVAGDILPADLGRLFLLILILTSLVIIIFTVRSGGWGGRLGLGFYQLFSTVFYMGDVLSYARLMALGMVGAGFGMAINVLVKLASGAPYVGWAAGAVVFVLGHLLNIALSVLGAFVHTMRLQFVEFFPKFFTGGGQDFLPLRKDYKYIEVKP